MQREASLCQIDSYGSNLLHDFPSGYQIERRQLNLGTSMPSPARGSPFHSLDRTIRHLATMNVQVDWLELKRHTNRLWYANYCLYAYLPPFRNWLLYVGKVCGCTVRQRLQGKHKEQVFRDIEREYGIESVRVLLGGLLL